MVLKSPQNENFVCSSRDICWAYFSDSKEALIGILTDACQNKLRWDIARSLGMGYWLLNPEMLVSEF